MTSLLANLWCDRRGQDITEYALIGGLVASIAAAIVPELISLIVHVDGVLGSVTQAAAKFAL